MSLKEELIELEDKLDALKRDRDNFDECLTRNLETNLNDHKLEQLIDDLNASHKNLSDNIIDWFDEQINKTTKEIMNVEDRIKEGDE